MGERFERPLPPLPPTTLTPRQEVVQLPYDDGGGDLDDKVALSNNVTAAPLFSPYPDAHTAALFMHGPRVVNDLPYSSQLPDQDDSLVLVNAPLEGSDSRFSTVKAKQSRGNTSFVAAGQSARTGAVEHEEIIPSDEEEFFSPPVWPTVTSMPSMHSVSLAGEDHTEEWRVNVFEDLVRYQRSNKSNMASHTETGPSESAVQASRRPSEPLVSVPRPASSSRAFSHSVGSHDNSLSASARSALPDPSTFPVPSASLPSSGSVSPAASRHGHLHYSSDMSASTRASVSTRASTWTEKSCASSTAASPGPGRSSLMSDISSNRDKEVDDPYGAIEVTSHAEYASGPRRSRTVTANSSREGSVCGPTQHHRPTGSRHPSSDYRVTSDDNGVDHPLPSPALPSSALSNQFPIDAIPPRLASRSRAKSEASRRGKTSTPTSPVEQSSDRLRHADSFGDLMSRSDGVTSPPRTSSLRRSGRKHSASVSSRSMTSSPVSRSRGNSDAYARPDSTSSGSSLAQISSVSAHTPFSLNIDTREVILGQHAPRSRKQQGQSGSPTEEKEASTFGSLCRLSTTSTDASSDERDSYSHFGFVDAYIDSPEDSQQVDEEPNALRVLDEGLGQVIEARGQPFEDVEHEIGANATHLLLAGCASERLTAFLSGALPRLGDTLLVLDVSSCGLVALPNSLSSCLALEELNISCNPFTSTVLPHFLGDLTTLRVLVADDIGVRSLPTSLAKLSELQTLSLRHNLFTHLPPWIHCWTKLERLCIDGNAWEGPYAKILGPILGDAGDPAYASKTFSGHRPRLEQSLSAPPSSIGDANIPTSPALPAFRRHIESGNSSPTSETFLQPAPRPFARRVQSGNPAVEGNSSASLSSPSPLNYYDSDSLSYDEDPSIGRSSSVLPSPLSASITGDMLQNDLSSQHTRGEVDEWGVTPEGPSRRSGADSISKWSFLRKMGRKSSTQRLLADVEAFSSVSPSRVGTPAASESGSRRPSVVTPSPALQSSASSPLSPLDSARLPIRKRQSFLPVALPTAVSCDDAAHPAEMRLGTLTLEDAEIHKRRLRALLHYFRDLDDLGTVSSVANPANLPIFEKMQSFRAGGASSSDSRAGPMTGDTDLPKSSEVSAEARDLPNRRKRILLEMLSSEESYLRGLGELVEIYVRPAMQPLEAGSSSTLPAAEHRAAFSNVEGLYQFHRDAFLPSLRAAVQPLLDHETQRGPPPMDNEGVDEADAALTAHVAEDVAQVFSRHAAFFQMYSGYINNCDNAQQHVQAWLSTTTPGTNKSATISAATGAAVMAAMGAANTTTSQCTLTAMTSSQRKKLKAFMKRCRTDPRHSQLNVESYLLLPVQRLPRYRLLLDDLVRHTPTARLRNQETPATTAALGYISRICSLVNESKRQSEQDRKLLAWQARIKRRWPSPLVQPHRRLIKDGTLILSRVVKRVPAFVAEHSASVASDDASVAPDSGVSVSSLQQSSLNLPLILILCNDITVAVSDTSGGRDENAPVELYTVLRKQVGKAVSVVGGTNVRIVDTRSVYYFTARTPQEADAWCDAINAHGSSD